MATIAVRVTPAARGDSVTLEDTGIQVCVKAPPVAGRANRRVEEVLARELRLPKAAVAVRVGAGARRKLVEVDGLSREQIIDRLQGAD